MILDSGLFFWATLYITASRPNPSSPTAATLFVGIAAF